MKQYMCAQLLKIQDEQLCILTARSCQYVSYGSPAPIFDTLYLAVITLPVTNVSSDKIDATMRSGGGARVTSIGV